MDARSDESGRSHSAARFAHGSGPSEPKVVALTGNAAPNVVPFPEILVASSGLIAWAIGYSQPAVIEPLLSARVRQESSRPRPSSRIPCPVCPRYGIMRAVDTGVHCPC